jgi:hypothetical protein
MADSGDLRAPDIDPPCIPDCAGPWEPSGNCSPKGPACRQGSGSRGARPESFRLAAIVPQLAQTGIIFPGVVVSQAL